MPRPERFPQLAELNIGESLFLSADQAGSIQNIRNIVSAAARRLGVTLEVHHEWRDGTVEIARVPPRVKDKTLVKTSVQRISRADMHAEIARIRTELNAAD